MPYLNLPTHRLHYRMDGVATKAPWLVFCNSLGTDLHMWDVQVAALSDHFRILRYDRRGHGGSSAPPPPYALADLGGDVIALLDALDIRQSHFCGLSIGGLTGQWLGIHAADRFDQLVLCATAARIGSAEGWAARITEVTENGLAALVPGTGARWFTPAFSAAQPETVRGILQQFEMTSVEGYVGCCAALAGADLRADIAQIANPVLTISGSDDPVCPPADLAAIAATVCQGRAVSLPGRHLVNIEAAGAFNATLLNALTGRM
ncbi:3-oxoadipate enol-lactonase [Phaeovulum sp. W22_SRMD_FR3]|uniref:3-oxoadipate enol-lactonase n=1 Tax=Phaeovulum sp. W22_SRMD_FR3 TaxID=3240274 RepID=UPI003F9E8BD8